MERRAEITRKTNETDIRAAVCIDGRGRAQIECPIGFFRHILTSFACHGLFDIELRAAGDTEVDQHHLIEDTGLCLGLAFARALGAKEGIVRVGSCLYPMDETLARAAVDLSGRPFLVYDAALSGIPLVSADAAGKSAPFQTDCVADFWQAFSNAAAVALHLDILRGRSDHHKIEALFKAAGRALRDAAARDPRAADRVPSTKGVLEGGGVLLC
jgi:imidazoleglycerol-phosphate dehydratase